MSHILGENINIIQVYNVCIVKSIKWNTTSRNLCDTLRQKKMCYDLKLTIDKLLETKQNYVNIMDDSENIEPSYKKLYL